MLTKVHNAAFPFESPASSTRVVSYFGGKKRYNVKQIQCEADATVRVELSDLGNVLSMLNMHFKSLLHKRR